MYHRIGRATNAWEKKLCISADNFRAQMQKLYSKGYTTCSIDDFINWLYGNCQLPRKSFLITFDDGYAGIYQHAYPVLKEKNWSATVFLVSSLIGKQDIWCQHENPSGKSYQLLDPAQILEMAERGFSFHSHSRRHSDLRLLDNQQLENEVHGSREDIETLLNKPVRYIAYPYGRCNDNVVNVVKNAGYKAAFSVQPGFNRHDVDPYRIRRLDVFGTDTANHLLRKIKYGSNNGAISQTYHYYSRRILSRIGVKADS